MSQPRFIALICGDETATLLARHPNAFLLLTQIAMRAKWKDCPVTGLRAGQALIRDWREAGLKSEKFYRTAKDTLAKCGLVAFRGASNGTVATIQNSTIFSLSTDDRGGQTGEQRASKGRAKGEQRATNHTETQSTRIHSFPPDDFENSPKEIPLAKREETRLAEEIYEAYPRKVARPEALKAIKAAMRSTCHKTLLEKTREYADAIRWKESRFIPHPATWFNQGRYTDDPAEWRQSKQTNDWQQRKAARECPEPPRDFSGIPVHDMTAE